MGSTIGKKKGAFAFWWNCDDHDAPLLRFVLVIVAVFLALTGASQYMLNSTKLTLNDFSSVEPGIYAPGNITKGIMELKELAVVKINRHELEKIDTKSVLHFVRWAENGDNGINVEHVVKATNESTHVYQYIESFSSHPYNFWFRRVPKVVEFNNGMATVKWKYESIYPVAIPLTSVFISLVMAILICKYWNAYLKRRWAKMISG